MPPLKAQLLLEESLSAYFPEMVFTDSGITVQLHRNTQADKECRMARYSSERKAALLKKLLPPINMSVAELARQENISEVTLYNWRKHAKDGGSPVPGDNKLTDEWPAEAKFGLDA